ncbi:hypothetical protein AALB81_18195 [Lachnospiraceae bacterium 48-33]
MKQEDIEKVEKMLYDSDGYMGYAYLYPIDGGERKEFVFEMTPDNIANFLGAHQEDVEKIILTDLADRLILDTIGGFIDRCPNQELCRQIIHVLAPIQMGEEEAKEIPIVNRETYDAYGRWEDGMVTAAELGML